MDPFHATPNPVLENTESPNPVHTIPSGDVAILLFSSPTATHRDNCGDHATPNARKLNTAVVPLGVHVIPSGDVAIVFVP